MQIQMAKTMLKWLCYEIVNYLFVPGQKINQVLGNFHGSAIREKIFFCRTSAPSHSTPFISQHMAQIHLENLHDNINDLQQCFWHE
jgi:hypothetical protein